MTEMIGLKLKNNTHKHIPYKFKILIFMLFPAQGTAWASGQEEHFVALAEHDFDGQREDELTFQRGQRINVAPKGRFIIFRNITFYFFVLI